MLLLIFCPAQAGTDSPRDLAASGNRSYQAGNFAEALESYDRALELMPDCPEILFDKGNAHFLNGQFEKARDAYGRSAQLSADRALKAKAHFNSACAAARQALGDSEISDRKCLALLDLSISQYREALRLDAGYRRQAGRGIEIARLAILRIREKVWVQAAPSEQSRNRGLNGSTGDTEHDGTGAESAENAPNRPPSGSEIPGGMEVRGNQQGARGEDGQSQSELRETPADIMREEAEDSAKFRRSFHVGGNAGKDW